MDDMDNASTTEYSDIDGLEMIVEPYELVWTPAVVSRVAIISIVMLLTLLGNISLISVIICNKKLRRKRVNIFLVNLAIGDLTVCCITMTTEILFVAFGEWVLGEVLCKAMTYAQIVTLASATFLLTGMSIDRYQVIVKPLQSLRGQPKIWRKVIVAWTLALICASPQAFIFVQTDEGLHPDGRIKHMCLSRGYTAPWQRKLYFTYLTCYILVGPMIVMSYCYCNIIRVVWMRGVSKDTTRMRFNFAPKSSTVTNMPKKLISASKRNVIKMTLSVIIAFIACNAPYFVVSLIRIYSDYTIKISNVLNVVEIITLCHSALNPILYGMFSTKAARKICGKVCKCCRNSNDTSPCDTTVVSDDETCITELPGINHNIISGSGMNHTSLLRHRIQERWGSIIRSSNSKRNKSNPKVETHVPLLIYGKRKLSSGNTGLDSMRSSNCGKQTVHKKDENGLDYLSTL